MFRVFLLKPHKGELPQSPTPLPSHSIDNHPIMRPTTILDKRNRQINDTFTPQVLVQWEGCPPKEATLEDLIEPEDQVVSQGGRNDLVLIEDPKTQLQQVDEDVGPIPQ